MLMRWKLNDAHIELNKARKNQTKIRREGEPLLRRESRQLMNEFETLRDRERERVRTNLRVKSSKKVNFLTKKWKMCSNQDDRGIEKINGVTVSDQKLPDSFESNPRIYGNTT